MLKGFALYGHTAQNDRKGTEKAIYMEKRGSGLKKICDLSASLDGYKEELHPEFTSEANVFYTTIKNVNYPPKDEKWVVLTRIWGVLALNRLNGHKFH